MAATLADCVANRRTGTCLRSNDGRDWTALRPRKSRCCHDGDQGYRDSESSPGS